MKEPVLASRHNIAAMVASRIQSLRWRHDDLAREGRVGAASIDQLSRGLGYFYIPDLMRVLRVLGITLSYEPTWPADRYHMAKTHNIYTAEDGRRYILRKGERLGKGPTVKQEPLY